MSIRVITFIICKKKTFNFCQGLITIDTIPSALLKTQDEF